MTEHTTGEIEQVDSIDTVEPPQTKDQPRRARLSQAMKLAVSRLGNRRRRRGADTGESRAALREIFDSEARLSWVLAWLAGLVGAVAFTHSAGYFVTTATGNTQRAVAGLFIEDSWLSISATLLVACFLGGVIVGSLGRRFIWRGHPHGPMVLTTLCLSIATIADILRQGWSTAPVAFIPILVIAFGIGALNTTFVRDGEVSISLSYVTGTVVKLGQGIERHISGGSAADWLGHFLLFASFVAGGLAGGYICSMVSGSQLLAAAAVACALTTGYTYFYSDRRALAK